MLRNVKNFAARTADVAHERCSLHNTLLCFVHFCFKKIEQFYFTNYSIILFAVKIFSLHFFFESTRFKSNLSCKSDIQRHNWKIHKRSWYNKTKFLLVVYFWSTNIHQQKHECFCYSKEIKLKLKYIFSIWRLNSIDWYRSNCLTFRRVILVDRRASSLTDVWKTRDVEFGVRC